MNIYSFIHSKLIDISHELVEGEGAGQVVSLEAITAEPPRDASHGDVATNAALVLAKPLRKNPRELAAMLAERLEGLEEVESVAVAGPGFINLTIKPAVWYQVLQSILRLETQYGTSNLGKDKRINVEYVSANPTGPMHIGHARGAVIGDALARLLDKAGYDVTKEYYINDAGGQVETLARSAYLRYREAAGEAIEIPEGFYPGDYLIPVGAAFFERHQAAYLEVPEEEWLPAVRRFALDAMMAMIRHDLLLLGIEHDVFTSERALTEAGEVNHVLMALEDKGLVYTGVLEPPKGKTPEDWEPREQLLFRASQFGDDTDRPLRKSDGTHTYFAGDLAYHHDKLRRGFAEMVLTLGVDHGGYVKRMKAGVAAMSGGTAMIDILLYQLVNFLENGEPMKMSKRRGTFITVRDVAEAVGKDVLRFIMLTRKHDAPLDFDLQKVKEQSRDNPVFYVQYAHARCCSVLRNAHELDKSLFSDHFFDLTSHFPLLTHEAELALIKVLAQWPRVVESAAQHREPHRIAYYLQELAGVFHTLWTRGKEDESLRFLIEHDRPLTLARLALVQACAWTLASGLDVVGVEPVREL
ncbi:MAG: arginine--tRNA ligase [Rickettsiales bacterium]|nr:arginine--tRNA ligase [Rickettsiales bacterium]